VGLGRAGLSLADVVTTHDLDDRLERREKLIVDRV
jgi:hypothetical protein